MPLKVLENLQDLLARDPTLQQRLSNANDIESSSQLLLDTARTHGLALSLQDIQDALSQTSSKAWPIELDELEELAAGRKTLAMGVIVLGRLLFGRELHRRDEVAEKAASQGGGGGGSS
jgi:hypothetical protein